MKKIIDTIKNKKINKNPPIWIMRQAGRYLPEYMEVRSGVSNFLDLCYNPKLASEVTIQPIERFGFDAAIIFSDILVIPDALGLDVNFVKGEGPKLSKIDNNFDLKKLDQSKIKTHLNPVYEALDITKSKLDDNTALIGFCGCPFTLACYMIEGGGSKNFDLVKQMLNKDEEYFSKLIEILTESVIEHLKNQIEAGADIVKIFGSWAGILTPKDLQKFVINPAIKIVDSIKKQYPEVPVICFPKGIGVNYIDFSKQVKSDVLAIDQNLNRYWVRKNLQDDLGCIIQGNLDNYLLAFGNKKDIELEVKGILADFGDQPFIFNLGHGILPQTKIENVELVIDLVRSSS